MIVSNQIILKLNVNIKRRIIIKIITCLKVRYILEISCFVKSAKKYIKIAYIER